MKQAAHSKVNILRTVYVLAALAVLIALGVSFPAIRKDIPILKTQDSNPRQLWDEAVAQAQKGDVAQAILSFQHYLESGGQEVATYLKLSELYVKAGQLNQAMESARKYNSLAPSSADGFFQLGIVNNVLGQLPAAVENYKKAVELDPKQAQAYFNLGFLSESDGRYLEAIDFYKKTVEANPKHALAYYNLGNSYAALEKDDDAIRCYKSSIENNKSHMDSYVNLSIILARNGRYGEAIPYLDEARVLGYEAPEEFLKELEIYREGADRTP